MPKLSLASFSKAEGKEIRLSDCKPDEDLGLTKNDGEAQLAENLKELEDLQYRLFADSSTAILIVLQGIDTAGKDGTMATRLKGTRVLSFTKG